MMPRTRMGPGVRVNLFLISLVGSTLFTGINGQTTSPAGGPPDIDGPENVTVRASSGEEVRLECTARGDPKVVEIEWFVGRGRAQPVRPGGEEYTMEEHLSASPPKSVLVITKMKDTLANKYTCWALNASGQKDIKHFDVQFSRSESRIGGKEGAIAGGVLGALLIMTVIAVVVFYLWKRKQKQPQNMADKDGSNYDFHELEAELEAQD